MKDLKHFQKNEKLIHYENIKILHHFKRGMLQFFPGTPQDGPQGPCRDAKNQVLPNPWGEEMSNPTFLIGISESLGSQGTVQSNLPYRNSGAPWGPRGDTIQPSLSELG